jgi:hypothetical protein
VSLNYDAEIQASAIAALNYAMGAQTYAMTDINYTVENKIPPRRNCPARHRDRDDDCGRGVHPVALRRSRRELVDERRARPAGVDPRVQGRRGASLSREGRGVGESGCGGAEGEVLRFYCEDIKRVNI